MINTASQLCPVCGNNGALQWLRTSDRYHDRPELYDLARCPACSYVWLQNVPSPDEMAHHYGEDYDKCIGDAGDFSPERWRDRRTALAQHKSGGDILDLGCSSGSFLETLKGSPWKLHGVEMSSAAARKAEDRTGANVFVGDILDAPFRPESFDAITCFDVLEHVYEPQRVLAKVQEWLKPGGIYYVLVPNIDSAESRFSKRTGTTWSCRATFRTFHPRR